MLNDSDMRVDEPPTAQEKPDHIGWKNFTPIHAACMASHVCDDFIELLIDEKVDMSQWGQKLLKRPLGFGGVRWGSVAPSQPVPATLWLVRWHLWAPGW